MSTKPWAGQVMRNLAVILAVGLAGVLMDSEVHADSWAETSRLSRPRHSHTATLLPSGRVLIAGGTFAFGFLSDAEEFDPSTGIWTAVGSLAEARDSHTATLLASGHVLVVGGQGASGLPSSTEIYDPSTGTWSSTGSVLEARSHHTATLLASGRVLVVGGTRSPGILESAEEYDPATGLWTTVGSLSAGRWGHTATLLASGEVLVVGGESNSGFLAGAELYDPASGSWTTVGSLTDARSGHTATLLASGEVLVAGGDGRGRLASAEVFDPATGTWTVVTSLTEPRRGHTATLLPSGKLLIAAGSGLSGAGSSVRLTSAEVYDSVANSWTVVESLATDREFHTATLLVSGVVLVAGGQGSAGIPTSAEVYDPGAGSWSPVSPLAGARIDHTATLLASGQVLVVGGGAASSLSTAELFDPATGLWTAVGSLLDARSGHTATLLPSGRVLVTGGVDNGGFSLSTAEVYDPATGLWTAVGSLAEGRFGHTATLLATGRVLVAGGFGNAGSSLATAELFDPSSGLWTMVGSLSEGRFVHTATRLASGRVLVVGGDNVGPISSAEVYDPLTGNWTTVGSLADDRFDHTATLLPSGQVLVAGGARIFPLSSVELFDPVTGSWTLVNPLAGARRSHTATLLASGRVLVVGGGDGNLGTSALSSAEVFDPSTGNWTSVDELIGARRNHSTTLLTSGSLLLAGGAIDFDALASAESYTSGFDVSRRPVVAEVGYQGLVRADKGSDGVGLQVIGYERPFEIGGTGFGGDSESASGATNSSAANHPFVWLQALEGEAQALLPLSSPLPVFCPNPDTASYPLGFCSDRRATLAVIEIPPIFDPGPHLLTVFSNGVPSQSQLVDLECSLSVSLPPVSAIAIGEQATFGPAATRGVRRFQWQQCLGARETICAADGVGWIDIPGATAPSYTTPPITGPESGTLFRVVVDSGCMQAASTAETLSVIDDVFPEVEIIEPSGGEFWLLSDPDEPPRLERISWEMSDDIRICQVEASLLISTDGGSTFQAAQPSGGLPVSFGPGGACVAPAETTSGSTYQVPTDFSLLGGSGSLYKVRVEVTDHAGRTTIAESLRPFFIVRPNPESVKTLILSNVERMRSRMGIPPNAAGELELKLFELAAHPRVQGRVIDLAGVTTLAALYDDWDAGTREANDVLFAPGGIHEQLRGLLEAFSGVEYLVLVGDDRIVPLARLPDRTAILSEASYPQGDEITESTEIGRALAANQYLSDDPLATRDPLTPVDLPTELFIPDLITGRLVENPDEIVRTIATFISQDGVLDLSLLDPVSGNKAQVTGYDFLIDSGNVIAERWRNVLGDGAVDDELLSADWDESTVADRRTALGEHLCGDGGDPFAVLSLNGHATHFEEGVPGNNPFDIQGLAADDIDAGDVCSGAELDLAGRVVYAVGCHGGLPVPGSDPGDADHSLDLPQTMMGRGVVSYVANTGYGWGLRQGIGYGERLVQIMTEELTLGGSVAVGEAVKNAKLRYFLETPRFDVYDEKSVMQWTFFGLPMYTLRSGVNRGPEAAQPFRGPAPALSELPAVERLGGVTIRRELGGGLGRAPLPAFLTRLDLHFDYTAPGVYTKRNHLGEVQADAPGCADPEGCYYTLNGVFERGSGESDLPIQPTFTFDSRLRGTSQHGVLWKGGVYDQESGWVPLIGELASNAGDFSDHGSTPRIRRSRPTAPRFVPGEDPPECRPSDLEVNSLVVESGELLKEQDSSPEYDIQRLYRGIDLEVFYFNDTVTPGLNCDRTGPQLGDGPHHVFDGSRVRWAVPATDDIDGVEGVWRVLVVWSDGSVDVGGQGRWQPVELDNDGSGIWRGSLPADGLERLTYVVQAVDARGNVTWLEFTTEETPASGIDPSDPLPVDVDLVLGPVEIFNDGFESGDTSSWVG